MKHALALAAIFCASCSTPPAMSALENNEASADVGSEYDARVAELERRAARENHVAPIDWQEPIENSPTFMPAEQPEP